MRFFPSIYFFFLILVGSILAQSSFSYITSFYSPQLARIWTYKVYFPAGYYEKSDYQFPVVYLLHGSDGDENDWDFAYLILDSLIDNRLIPPTFAISPVTGTSWWVNTPIDNYESAFIYDLIPEINKKYRTINDRDGRGIAGYSMGGYGALRYALVYSELFAAAIILSPSIYDGLPPLESSARSSGAFGTPFDEKNWINKNYPTSLRSYFEKKILVPIFIATGDDDYHHDEDLKFNIEQQAVLLYGKLHKLSGNPAELRIVNGGHNIEVWERTFCEGIQYIFKYMSAPQVLSNK